MVVSIESVATLPSFLTVTQWILDKCQGKNALPEFKTHTINKSDVFQNTHVIVPNYMPIEYLEEPICVRKNSFRHPMSEKEHCRYVSEMLNSRQHKLFKENWLWESYLQSIQFPRIWDRWCNQDINKEKRLVRKNKILWNNWLKWKNTILKPSQTAPELIFKTSFDSCSDLIIEA